MLSTKGHRGRTARYRATPAQIPACGTIAPGFSEILASAKALGQTRDKGLSFTSGSIDNVRFHNAELGHKLPEPFPIIALALTAPVEILPYVANNLNMEKFQTSQVAMHAKVIEVPRQFFIQ